MGRGLTTRRALWLKVKPELVAFGYGFLTGMVIGWVVTRAAFTIPVAFQEDLKEWGVKK